MKCPNCGADSPVDGGKCSYCDTPLSVPRIASSRASLSRITGDEVYVRRNSAERLRRLPAISPIQEAFAVFFFLAFICVSGFILLTMLGMAGAGFWGFGGRPFGLFSLIPIFMSIVPVVFVVLGIGCLRAILRAKKEPVTTLAAIVLDKRTSGYDDDEGRRVRYFVTCEDESGDRQEHQLWDRKLFGRLAEGDVGVFFLRHGIVVDFDRIR